MADIVKLKKKAAEFEAKKQPDKVLALYRDIIALYDSGKEEPIDIPIYNRAGDLLQKAGNLPAAVAMWERAVDLYADGGFFNPAIALCNKILRQSPGRAVIYYKLGKISADKGFKGDAKQNYLEYASRMQTSGNLDEAFRALKEFAEIVPDQDDVRLMLAEQLEKAGRKQEALEQLQLCYAQCVSAGRDADAIAQRMRAIDPTVEPRSSASGSSAKLGGLVFLEIDSAPAKRATRSSGPTTAGPARRLTKSLQGLTLPDTDLPLVSAPAVELPLLDFIDVGPPAQGRIAAEPPKGDFTSFGEPSATILDEAFGEFEPRGVEPMFALDTSEPERRTTSEVLANSVDLLRSQCETAPGDWSLRRQLAEALLDGGHRDAGIAELEVTLGGFEHQGDLDTAASVTEELVRIAPTVIRYHQKRVEFAFRADDRLRLATAYMELADALVGDGQAPKARVVYQRVLEIAPDDIRAQAALASIPDATVPDSPAPRRSTRTSKALAPAPAKVGTKNPEDDGFISVGDWLRDDAQPKNTRMVVDEQEPTGDEKADFADMLRKFKQGVSENVEDEDYEAHYDLGVAYKEMGLLDEAIAEFQKSLRGPHKRVRALETLGHCFVEKGQLPVAATILTRALTEPGVTDRSLVGVHYLLGTIADELELFADAKKFYTRVIGVDIRFRDVGARLTAVEKRLK